jgi:hypothetical protein
METVEEFTAERRYRLIVLDHLMHRVVRDVDMELRFKFLNDEHTVV